VPDRVTAVVVTFNRRQLLEECMRALFEQTHLLTRIYVVDNASSDGTAEWAEQLVAKAPVPISLIRLLENGGGAGGFAAGIAAARKDDTDWLWLMDDDAAPQPDTLELLVNSPPAREPATACVAPKVVYASGGLDANQRGHFHRRLRSLPESSYVRGQYPAIGYMSFVGTLLRADAVRQIGLPRADFFVWGDDVEYSLRLRQVGEIRLVSESVMVHKRNTHSHCNRRSRLLSALLPVSLYPTPIENFWQPLCGLRNYIWMKREYEGQSALGATGTTAQFLVKHLLVDNHPVTRTRWIVRFAREGRRGRFRNIPPERWRAMLRAGEL